MESTGKSWFCVRSHPKHEHIAAASLRSFEGVEVFHPWFRARRATRRGAVWVTESLFPNYLFARFALSPWLDNVRHARGVKDVVHFGSRWPVVPDSSIEELRGSLIETERTHRPEELAPGRQVMAAGGACHGLRAVVDRVMPAQQRVQVLLELLGRSVRVEFRAADLVPAGG